MKTDIKIISDDNLDEDFYHDASEEKRLKKVIAFYLGKEFYGFDINKVKEVVNVSAITFLPFAPPDILGIINLRGVIISVIDINKMLGLQQQSLSLPNQRKMIIIEHNELETGLLTDRIEGILDIPIAKIDTPIPTLSISEKEYFEGEIEIDGKLLGILRAERFLRSAD